MIYISQNKKMKLSDYLSVFLIVLICNILFFPNSTDVAQKISCKNINLYEESFREIDSGLTLPPYQDMYFYNDLSSDMKSNFDILYSGIANCEEKIRLENITDEELDHLIYIIHFDCPEIFYFCEKYTYSHIGSKVKEFYPKYTYEEATILKMKDELNKKINQIISPVINLSEYDTEKYIHDYIIENTDYSQETDNYNNIYGCLIERQANCKGYSAAFSYLLRQTKIPTTQVIGYASNNGLSSGHAWNLVFIDNKPYYTDVCWDDILCEENNDPHYMFFNLSFEKITISHNPDETAMYLGKIPTENNLYYNYYNLNNFCSRSENENEEIIRNAFNTAIEENRKSFEVNFDSVMVYNNGLLKISDIMKQEIETNNYDIEKFNYLEFREAGVILAYWS